MAILRVADTLITRHFTKPYNYLPFLKSQFRGPHMRNQLWRGLFVFQYFTQRNVGMNTVFVKKVIINVLTKLPREFEGLASKETEVLLRWIGFALTS